MSGYIQRVIDSVIGNKHLNQGKYEIEHKELSQTLYSVSIYCVRYQTTKTLAAWGYASTKAEAEELGETMESLFQMRHEHMQQ